MIRAAVATLLIAAAVPGQAADDRQRDSDWRRVATPDDRARLRGWRAAWDEALAIVGNAGGAPGQSRDPDLFNPDRALPRAEMPIGGYRCRTIGLAPRDSTAAMPIRWGGWARCTVAMDGAAIRFATTGSPRSEGQLFADTDARLIYLGTMVLADERQPMRYGRDARRDMAGIVERIGERRWRIVLPHPGFGATLDLIEVSGG